MQEALPHSDDRSGRGWRLGAWAALGVAALGWLLFPAPPEDKWDLRGWVDRVVIGLAFVIGPAVTAAVCAFQGAALSAAAGDRRPSAILPVWASCAFLGLLLLSLIT